MIIISHTSNVFKSYLVRIVLGLSVLIWILAQLHILDFNSWREQHLIKKNYELDSIHFFKTAKLIDSLPRVDINFKGDDYIYLEFCHQRTSSRAIREIDWDTNIQCYKTPFIWITDTNNFILHDNYSPFTKIHINDSILYLEANDSVYRVEKDWCLSYEGDRKSNNLEEMLRFLGLGYSDIDSIRSILGSINCFGFERARNGDLIINYRSNYGFTHAYSYLIDIGDTDNYIEQILGYENEILGQGIYSFNHNRIPVDGFGRIRYKNWNLK